MSNDIVNVTDASLEADVLNAAEPLLLDFWAPWCGPCKTLAPLLDEIAVDYSGHVRVAKINADENLAAVARYTVRGLPTLLLLKGGVEAGRIVGLTTKTRLAGLLDQHLEA